MKASGKTDRFISLGSKRLVFEHANTWHQANDRRLHRAGRRGHFGISFWNILNKLSYKIIKTFKEHGAFFCLKAKYEM
jgi:hypothetical protein